MTKKSFRETLEENDAAQLFYGAMTGKEPPSNWMNNLAPKRKYTKRASTEPSESEILKAIMQCVKHHPKVAIVWRQNSGVAEYGTGREKRYVRANSARGMSDVMGTLKTGRILAIEVKSRTGKLHDHQAAFLQKINDAGGLGFVARSVGDVLEKLKGA